MSKHEVDMSKTKLVVVVVVAVFFFFFVKDKF